MKDFRTVYHSSLSLWGCYYIKTFRVKMSISLDTWRHCVSDTEAGSLVVTLKGSLQTPAADCSQALQSFSLCLISAAQPVAGVLRLNSELRLETGVWPWLLYLLTVQSPPPARPVRELNTLYWTPLQANTAAPRWAELSEHICQVVYSVPRTQAHRQQQSGVDIMNYVNQGY